MASLQTCLARTQRLDKMVRRAMDLGRIPSDSGLDLLDALNGLAEKIEKRIAEEAQAGAVAL